MAKVVRVSTPSHFQVRKDVAIVNRKNRLSRLIDVLGALCVNVGVFLLVKVGKRCWQLRVRLFICRVACLQEFDTFLLYVRQTHRDISCGESLVHCSLRKIESMGRTVMTIDALHLVFGQGLDGIWLRVGADESLDLPTGFIAIFNPGNSLPRPVGRRIADVDPRDQRELRVCLRSCRRRSALT